MFDQNFQKSLLTNNEKLEDLAELFKTYGDMTRLRILFALSGGEICVTDLAESLEMTQSAVSHQLKVLKNQRLVSSKRSGKTIYYSLADEHVRTIILQGWDHINEDH
ncbi:ArsR/SmtB family transcription factor [Butyrivibrio sp. MC2013]|uniref:ArsR/SmtB family transcription factor n=1 Tax=Butyrivibrio sp. MC2013 TaxID=1280686 RepID=UPI000412ADB6|nr:metalloregulator ArsR/SmtB family transcription factor [Butyrivibrio sp. MC2013]